jgi:hypothetical protein
MNVSDFEEKVWAIEGIRIVVRAASSTVVNDYDFKKAADESWRVTEWLDKRVRGCINGLEVAVIQGDGEEPHGKVILRTLRPGYRA